MNYQKTKAYRCHTSFRSNTTGIHFRINCEVYQCQYDTFSKEEKENFDKEPLDRHMIVHSTEGTHDKETINKYMWML